MTETLRKALKALDGLSAEAQNAIATDILATVAEMERSSLTPQQQEEVEKRLTAPLDLASPEDVSAVFEKY